MSVLAYYDSFGGMLLCTALRNLGDKIELRVNTTSGGYKRGEIIHKHKLWTIPRSHYHKSRRGLFHYYTTPYNWDTLL